jgi:hypothetical protein
LKERLSPALVQAAKNTPPAKRHSRSARKRTVAAASESSGVVLGRVTGVCAAHRANTLRAASYLSQLRTEHFNDITKEASSFASRVPLQKSARNSGSRGGDEPPTRTPRTCSPWWCELDAVRSARHERRRRESPDNRGGTSSSDTNASNNTVDAG